MFHLSDPPRPLPGREAARPTPRWALAVSGVLLLMAFAFQFAPHLPPELRVWLPMSDDMLKDISRALLPVAMVTQGLSKIRQAWSDPDARPLAALYLMIALLIPLQVLSGLDLLPPALGAVLSVGLLMGFVGGFCWLFYASVIRPGGKRGWLSRNV